MTTDVDVLDACLCRASQAAYDPASDIAPSLAGSVLDAGGDVHAQLSEQDGMTVVAFRGTVPADWHDWFRDFAAWPERIADHPRLGLCHEGFLSGAVAMLPQLAGVLTTSKPFALTGHSLGGAMAIVAAALLRDGGLTAARLTTFGAPRVGMFDLAAVLAPIEGRRFRHGEDPVPEVPSWPYLNDRAWTRIGAATLKVNPIEDHAIAGYLAALGRPPGLATLGLATSDVAASAENVHA